MGFNSGFKGLTFTDKQDVSVTVGAFHPKGKNTLPQWALN